MLTVALGVIGTGRAPGQDTAAVRTVQRLRDRWFGDTSGFLGRTGYHAMSGLIDSVPPPADDRWHLSPTGDILIGGQQELGLGLGLSLSRPLHPGPSPVRAAFDLMFRYGINGSRDFTVGFAAPTLYAGWRFLALARSERMLRTPYFGPDNQELVQDSLEQRYGSLYYRYALLRSTGFATVQRQLVGPVWLHLAGQARYYRSSAIKEQPTLFANDVALGLVDDTTRYRGLEARLGVLVDTRDDWSAPKHGILAEALVAWGDLRNWTRTSSFYYRRYLFGLREFMTLDAPDRTVLALRQRVVLASDTLPYFLAYEQLTSGPPDDGIVGPRTLRLHGGGNQLASNQAFVSLDLRRELIVLRADPTNPVGLWGLVLADFGSLFEPREPFHTRRREWTLGVGARAQVSKGMLAGFDVGWTDTGPDISVVTYFAF